MITTINFDTEINFSKPTTAASRKRLTRTDNKIKARKELEKVEAKKDQQWDFTVKVVGTLGNGKIVDCYTDKFSIRV